MSLLVKVVSKTDTNIMDKHKKVADEKGCVWYCHSGNPKAKPYNKDNKPKEVFSKNKINYTKQFSKTSSRVQNMVALKNGPKQ